MLPLLLPFVLLLAALQCVLSLNSAGAASVPSSQKYGDFTTTYLVRDSNGRVLVGGHSILNSERTAAAKVGIGDSTSTITDTLQRFCVQYDMQPIDKCVAQVRSEVINHRGLYKFHVYEEMGQLFTRHGINPKDIEGHSAFYLKKAKLLQRLASDPRVETICEIGFNAGHSSIGFLLANTHAQIFSFDIGYHAYSAHALDYILERFPGRLLLTIGNSLITVPSWTLAHPDIKCNLLFVDGGHSLEVALGDLRSMHAMANTTYHRVIVDDVNMGGVKEAWEQMVHEGSVTQEEIVYDSYNENVCLFPQEDGLLSDWKVCEGKDAVDAPPGLDSAIAIGTYSNVLT